MIRHTELILFMRMSYVYYCLFHNIY